MRAVIVPTLSLSERHSSVRTLHAGADETGNGDQQVTPADDKQEPIEIEQSSFEPQVQSDRSFLNQQPG